MIDEVNVQFDVHATANFSAQTRYSFTPAFLRGAARFAVLAREIENRSSETVDEDARSDHRAFVSGAVMQSCAGLEAEITEVVEHGPGNHLGSNGIDLQGRDFLQPLAAAIDRQGALERYQLVLQLLRKRQFDKGRQPFQDAALLVRLRNEITHYRSKWGPDMDSEKLFGILRQLRLGKPAFISEDANFFPHQFLGADCAAWAVKTAVAVIDDFYNRLGISSSLAADQAKILAQVTLTT